MSSTTRNSRGPVALLAPMLLIGWAAGASGQVLDKALPAPSEPRGPAPGPRVQLPATAAELERSLAQLEFRIAEARRQLGASAGTTDVSATALAATPEELTERERLWQHSTWVLETQARALRRLKASRGLEHDRVAEQAAWRGFAQPPPYPLALVEHLRDAVSTQLQEEETLQVLSGINGGAEGPPAGRALRGVRRQRAGLPRRLLAAPEFWPGLPRRG